jgi:hypothetical protein
MKFDLQRFALEKSSDKGRWITLEGGGFEYTGTATNDSSKTVSFVLKGESIKSTDNLSIVNNLYVEAQGGNRIAINGLNGNAFVDDTELGISGDSNYAAHFTKSAAGIGKNIVLLNVSDGAKVSSNYSACVDMDAQITFGDGLHTIFTSNYMPTQNFTIIDAKNGGEGFSLNVSDGNFTEIGGLNDGYSISIKTGGNVSDELTFKTDGKQGTIAIANTTLKVEGDEEFSVKLGENGFVELKNFEGTVSQINGDAGDADGVMGFIGKLVGKVFSSIIETLADIFDTREGDNKEIRLVDKKELFDDENFIAFGDFLNFDKLSELVTINREAASPVETSPFQINSEMITAEIITAEKNNSEVIAYDEV